MRLSKLTLQNFMSFGNSPTVVELDRDMTTLIVGKNLDVGESGASRNGAGKTTAMQGILFALYGKGIDTEMSQDNFINNINEKKLSVTLNFYVGNDKYEIIRRRKPTDLTLNKIDEHGEILEKLTRDSMSNTDKTIVDLIGMDYEIFMATYFMNPHQKSFLSKTPAKQRDFVENVLSLDVLNKRAETMKTMKTDIKADLNIATRDLENETSNLRSNNSAIEVAENRVKSFDQQRDQRLAEIDSELDLLSQIDVEEERRLFVEISETKKTLNELKDERSTILEKTTTSSRKINTLQQQINKIGAAKVKADSYMSGLNIQRDDVLEKLREFDGITVEDLNAEIENYRNAKMTVQNRTSELQAEKQNISRSIESANRTRRTNADEVTKLNGQLEHLESGNCPFCKQTYTDDVKIEQIRIQIRDLENESNRLLEGTVENEKLLKEIDFELAQIDRDFKESYPDGDTDFVSAKRDLVRLNDELATIESKIGAGDVAKDEYDSLLTQYGSIEMIEAEISAIDAEVKTGEKLVKLEISPKISELSTKLNEIQEKSIAQDEKELAELTAQVGVLEKERESLKVQQNPHIDALEDLKKKVFNVDALERNVQALEKRLEHCDFLIRLLTDPKSHVRQNIVRQYIPFLNKKINEYARYLGLPHTVQVNSDMTTTISNGKQTTYFNMSQGERLRANIATTIAFGDLLRVLGKDCNLIMFDELLDSAIDQYGGVQIMKFIKEKFKNFWMISHRDDFTDFVDEIMRITKQGGFSSIEYL